MGLYSSNTTNFSPNVYIKDEKFGLLGDLTIRT